jgi:hypothetical protein
VASLISVPKTNLSLQTSQGQINNAAQVIQSTDFLPVQLIHVHGACNPERRQLKERFDA